MNYAQRAVLACVGAMKIGAVSPMHIKNVLKCTKVDVSPIEQFLESEKDFIRKYAVEIIGQRGNSSLLIDLALVEKDKNVLLAIMKQLAGSRESLEKMVGLLNSEDSLIKTSAIQMFRRANRADCLFPLLFDDDDGLVERIRKYIEEEDGKH
jgi:hypothetical protein